MHDIFLFMDCNFGIVILIQKDCMVLLVVNFFVFV